MGDGTAVMDPRALPVGGDKVLNIQEKIECAFVTNILKISVTIK